MSVKSAIEMLGPPKAIQRTARAIATLDLILSPEWEYRHYSYNAQWSPGEQMASMRNGEGDEWFLLFLESGWCGLKGLAHECEAAGIDDLTDRVRAVLPKELAAFRDEPAFAWNDTSFCYWFDPTTGAWVDAVLEAGFARELETGAAELLWILAGHPEDYQRFANEYFEANIPTATIDQFYNLGPLTDQKVRELNPKINIAAIGEECAEIGFPRAYED